MTDVVVDRLRIRGSGARRLATVAARTLPAALEDALGDLADGVLGPLTVTLDLDPDDYDDATLAVLWADRVRTAALAAGAARRSPGADAGRGPGARAGGDGAVGAAATADGGVAPDAVGPASVAGAGDLVALVRAWLDAGAPASAIPVALAAASGAAHLAALVGALGPGGAARLAAALGEVWQAAAPLGGAHGDQPGQPGATDVGAPAAAPSATPAGARPARAADPRSPEAPAHRLAAASDAVRPYLELAADDAGPAATADLTRATVVGGVVLCYPWLADLCRTAVEEHPGATPTHARRLALALLCAGPHVDPARLTLLLDDPLVRFLAGATPQPCAADPPAAHLAHLDTAAVALAADEVATRFAALLRGFERSTPGFVREQWLLRPGLLDLDRDPPRLVAATAPLDVVLGWLPYPVALLRLPWTPPLTVRMRP